MKIVKMTRVSIPESEYLSIKKEMKEHNEQKFICYLNRIKLQCQNLEGRNKELIQDLRESNEEVVRSHKEVVLLERYNVRLQDAVESLGYEIDSKDNALRKLNIKLSDVNKTIDSKNTEIKDLNKQIEALNERLESVCYYNERLSDSEKVLCRRIDDMKCWKGHILNIFGWELFQTPFKRSCKKSKK